MFRAKVDITRACEVDIHTKHIPAYSPRQQSQYLFYYYLISRIGMLGTFRASRVALNYTMAQKGNIDQQSIFQYFPNEQID